MEIVSLAYDVFETRDTKKDAYPIVLTHGLSWNKYMLSEIAEELCDATKRKVYSIDLRNHGESPWLEDCDLLLMAEDVKKFLKDHDLEKVTFVSHSLSCTVAYLVALEQPEQVEKLVMIDHPPFGDRTKQFYTDNVHPQFAAQERFLKTLDPNLTLFAARRKILSLSEVATTGQKYFLKKVAHDLVKENGKFKWKPDQQFLIDRYKDGSFTVNSRGFSDHEILIIRCKDSARISDQKFEAVRKHNPKSKMITFNNTSHLLMFEKKAEFVKVVAEFLSH